ncbi:hypothetical protein [Sphaerotilus mobilis]|uniref:hypothetical protein n=1 Tax=Sphaerotilus mobilis TaxID=47994 RepID=UPI00102CE870|nr:hypothetical protein [Sphaerotilus mobilis]
MRRSGLQAWLDETEGHPIESVEALVRWWSVLDKRQRRRLCSELEPALDEPADWVQCGLFERTWFDGRDRALWWLTPRIEGLPGCPIDEDKGHHGRRPFALLCVGVEEANAWAQEVGLLARFVEFSPSADLVDAIGWIGGDV